MTQTIEMWLMTNWGYTWERACELVNDHIDRVAQWKQVGFNNDQIADKLIQLKAESTPL